MVLVSVIMITYCHDRYILDAIEGVMNQQCDFDIELIVANDCSPDNTDLIVTNFLSQHSNPSWIKYTKHDENIGMQRNFIWASKQCKGKYIAMCEGDDYWTDPLKLQKQVDFLNSNSDYVICFHRVNVLKPNGKVVSDFITRLPDNYHLRDVFLINGNYMHTPSVMYRNFLVEFPKIFEFAPEGDFLLYVLLTKFGKIGYIKDVMAIYRYNVGVISRSKDKYFNNILIVNMISLRMVDDDSDLKLLIQRNLDFALYQYTNLPISILIKNIVNIPNRLLKKYLFK